MKLPEKHITYRWRIESKPEGGFIARADKPADTIEAATHEEIEAKIREKLAAMLGPDFSELDLTQPGPHVETQVEKKFSFSLGEPSPGTPPDAPAPAQRQDVSSGSIEPVGGSLLPSLWKAAVLVGIAMIIWLLLHKR